VWVRLDTLVETKGPNVKADLPSWAERIAVLDTETTGVDPHQARVVSCTIAVLGSAGEVSERTDWLLDPGVPIPAGAASVHGISTEVARSSGVAAKVGIDQIMAELASMVARGFPVVVYNAPYDLTLLRAECTRHDVAWLTGRASTEPLSVIDPLVIDKQVDRYRKGKRTLDFVTEHYGVTLGAAHDAGEDAIAAGRVAQAIGRKYRASLPDDARELHQAQITWAAEQAASFQEYMRRVRDPQFVADGAWPLR